jgi:hypothetical protein
MGEQGEPGDPGVLRIDCAECVLEGTEACADCVVTWLVDREPGEAVVIDVAEVRALRTLGEGGLVPRLRHRPRAAGW